MTDYGSFVNQLHKFLVDQHRELTEIHRKEDDLKKRQADLMAEKDEVIRGIMKTEVELEKHGKL